MKVLHCPVVIVNSSIFLAKYLNRLGVESKTISYFKTWIGYQGDINLNLDSVPLQERNRKIRDFFTENESFFDSFDIIHYHFMDTLTFGTSFGGWNAFPEREKFWELDYFKKKGKKIIFTTYGSDVRNNSLIVYFQALFQDREKLLIRPPLNNKNQYLKNFEISKYADAIVHGSSDLIKHTPFGIMIPVIVDTEKMGIIKKKYPKKNDNVLVFHSPTDNFKKGTKHILKVIEKVKRIENINFKVCTGLLNTEMHRFFSATKGIYIDQVNYGFGCATLENLFFNNQCLCSNEKSELLDGDPRLLAPVSVFRSEKELEEKILEKYSKFQFPNSEEYVEQYFSGKVIARQYHELYQMLLDNQKVPFIVSQQWIKEFGELIKNKMFAKTYYSDITDYLLKTKEYDKLQHEIINGIGLANDIELYAKLAFMAKRKGDKQLYEKLLRKYNNAEFKAFLQQAEYISKEPVMKRK